MAAEWLAVIRRRVGASTSLGDDSISIRDKVIEEAIAQCELRPQKLPIPANLQRYARRSGLRVVLTCRVGAVLVAVPADFFGTLYWGVILFFGLLAAIGFLQLVTGLT